MEVRFPLLFALLAALLFPAFSEAATATFYGLQFAEGSSTGEPWTQTSNALGPLNSNYARTLTGGNPDASRWACVRLGDASNSLPGGAVVTGVDVRARLGCSLSYSCQLNVNFFCDNFAAPSFSFTSISTSPSFTMNSGVALNNPYQDERSFPADHMFGLTSTQWKSYLTQPGLWLVCLAHTAREHRQTLRRYRAHRDLHVLRSKDVRTARLRKHRRRLQRHDLLWLHSRVPESRGTQCRLLGDYVYVQRRHVQHQPVRQPE
jgi:hypothetical protein